MDGTATTLCARREDCPSGHVCFSSGGSGLCSLTPMLGKRGGVTSSKATNAAESPAP